MRQAFATGFTDAVHRSPLVVVLWQVNLLYGAIFAGLAATALAVTLDGSWATRSLLHDLDPTVFFALDSHHLPTLKLLGAAAVMLTVLYLAAWVPIYGALVASVCGDEELGIRDSLRAGAGVVAVFLRIALVAAAVFVLLVGGIGVAAFLAMRLAREAAAPGYYELAVAGGAIAGVLVWILCGAVHDHARIRCFATGEGALRSYGWALGFVLRGGRRAYLLALAVSVVGGLVAAFYQAVASSLSTDWMTGVVLSILWGQAMLLARSLFRVWIFAAEARLQGAVAEP
jgi:hypothetical protein